jgi:hypothetical protein
VTKAWIQFAMGFWILISPWLLGFSEISLAKWSNVLLGLTLILLNSWTVFKGREIIKSI